MDHEIWLGKFLHSTSSNIEATLCQRGVSLHGSWGQYLTWPAHWISWDALSTLYFHLLQLRWWSCKGENYQSKASTNHRSDALRNEHSESGAPDRTVSKHLEHSRKRDPVDLLAVAQSEEFSYFWNPLCTVLQSSQWHHFTVYMKRKMTRFSNLLRRWTWFQRKNSLSIEWNRTSHDDWKSLDSSSKISRVQMRRHYFVHRCWWPDPLQVNDDISNRCEMI